MNLTQFDEVNNILKTLVNNLQEALGGNLVGVYLYGSLIWGDFNENVSDIDLLVVTENFLNQNEFVALNAIHDNLVKRHVNWNDRIEIAYIAKKSLKTFKSSKSSIAVISPGEPFNIKDAGKDWLINYFLIQEKSITLLGPDPTTIIDPISKSEFISGVRDQALEWRHWIVNTKGSIGYQFYAVLTICRALYALHHGEQGSKTQAANWMMSQSPKWANLIKQSWDFKSQVSNNVNRDSLYNEVEKFIFEMLDSIK